MTSRSLPVAWLLRMLEWIGVDRSQLPPDDQFQFEFANLPTAANSLVVLSLVLIFGYGGLWLFRRRVDAWRPLHKFLLVVGSLVVFVPLVTALLTWGHGSWPEFMSKATSVGPFILIMGLGFWVPWLYRWEIDTCSLFSRRCLAVLRFAVLALLVLVLLSPELVPLEEKEFQKTLLVLRDKSQSFDIADEYRDPDQAKTTAEALGLSTSQLQEQRPTRASVVDAVISQEQYKFLRELEERGKVLVVDFDTTVSKPIDPRQPLPKSSDASETTATAAVSADQKADDTAAKNEPNQPGEELADQRPFQLNPIVADGRGSDLWLAIHESLASRAPAVMIMFSDGQHTGQEVPREAAEEAARQGVKVFVVGVGDPARPKNLRVDTVYAQPNVGTKDAFQIEASLSAQDIDPQTVALELIEQKLNPSDGSLGAEKTVGRLDVLVNKPKLVGLEFEHTQTEPGKYVYSVRVQKLEDESNLDDNQASSAPVNVLQKDNLKVLLVAGAPTWEYRLVQKLLTRDPQIHVSCWLQTLDEDRTQDGDRPAITRLPLSLPELNEYGVIMLFDPNPMEFDQPWIDTLKKYVGEHAGGVLYMAGPKFTAQFLSQGRTQDLRSMIPVNFGDVGAVEVMAMLSTNNRAYPLRVVPANADHDLLKFYPDTQASMQRWETLPGIFWSFPALSAKPTAQVLLEHSDTTLRTSDGARPLLVTGRYGAGHTAFIGFNGTWRWRQIGREAEFFDTFWIKVVNYLADSRSSQGRRYGSLATDKDRYEVGDRVLITARLNNASYEPLVSEQVEATLRTEDGAPISIPLKPVTGPGEQGKYEGFTTARRTGVHTLTVDIPAEGAVKPTVDEKNFSVELPRVELNQQWLNKPLLKEIATASGGGYFELNQLHELAAMIPDQTEKIIERGAPKPLWDYKMFNTLTLREALLGLMVGLLSIEWAFRKALKLL